jgi:hypothetical protein
MSLSPQQLDREAWLAKRLTVYGAVFAGVTDSGIRRDRIRQTILDRGLEHVIVGRNREGKPETYATCFERLYGVALRKEAA